MTLVIRGKPEPEDFQSGGLAYMLGEPNTRIEALQHAGVIADPRGLYTDPSIYSKGESEVQNYYAGGGVGQGPWTKGIAPGTPEQPPPTRNAHPSCTRPTRSIESAARTSERCTTKHGPGVYAAEDDAASDDESRKHGPRTTIHGS